MEITFISTGEWLSKLGSSVVAPCSDSSSVRTYSLSITLGEYHVSY
jgi:hypothetical protein